MKKILFLFIVFIIFQSQTTLLATNPISKNALNELRVHPGLDSKQILWSKAKIWAFKKYIKIAEKLPLVKQSKIALILGAASLILVLVFAFTGYWIVLAGGYLVSIIGGVVSLVVLQISKSDKVTFKKERQRARMGLIFSILAFVAPLALLIFLAALFTI